MKKNYKTLCALKLIIKNILFSSHLEIKYNYLLSKSSYSIHVYFVPSTAATQNPKKKNGKCMVVNWLVLSS
jgi:hypothetical protein